VSKIEIEFDKLYPLPKGWQWSPLEDLMVTPKQDIVDGPFGSNLKAYEYTDVGVPIARLQNIDRNEFVFKNIKYISKDKAEYLDRHNFKPGDILITKLGYPLGEACIAPEKIEHGIIVADLVRVRVPEYGIDRKYLTYAINSPFLIKQFENHTKGTTRPRVNLGIIRQLPIPLAPLEQQKRIVAEIEKHFSRLDEAVANLKCVKNNLKRYKAAVLKSAVEGKLTEEWRKQHPDVEPADKLLERILAERREKWQGRGKYKEPVGPDTSGLPELPEGWVWVSVEQIAHVGTGATPLRSRHEYYENGNVPWITSGALNDEFVSRANEYITDIAVNETNAKLFPVHTLLVAMYGEGKTRGKVSELLIEAATNQACAAIVTSDLAKKVRKYVKLFFLKNYEDIRRLSSGGVQPNLNLGHIKQTAIPLPPLAEQYQIVAEVERLLSIVAGAETQVDANMRRADLLRQSILKQAFSGQLVPQDPDDEPAGRVKAQGAVFLN
jgi:type I restriction enzyme S subunit